MTLVTDQSTHPLIAGAGFDEVVQVQTKVTAAMPHEFAVPLLARVKALRLSPYACTLALDVDARLRKPDLKRLFDICKKPDFAAAPCLLDTSRERIMYDKPIWNNGVLLYKNKSVVTRMLERFEVLFSEHLEIACSRLAESEC